MESLWIESGVPQFIKDTVRPSILVKHFNDFDATSRRKRKADSAVQQRQVSDIRTTQI